MTKTEERIASLISDIEKCIHSVKELQASRDLGLVFKYKSRNEELRKTPPNVTLPTFVAYEISNDQVNELFGSLKMESDDRKILEQDVKSMSLKAKDVERDELERRKSQNEENKVYIKCTIYIKRAFHNFFITYSPISPFGYFFDIANFIIMAFDVNKFVLHINKKKNMKERPRELNYVG